MTEQVSLVVFIIFVSSTLSCHFFINTTVNLVTKSGIENQTVTRRCFERKTFENVTVLEIHVEKQKVVKLEKDSIRHLLKLNVLTFSDCQIEEIETELFRNVPRLETITITRNKIRTIPSRIFSTLDHLQVLDLSRNRIETIQSGGFGNSTLKEINLSFNIIDEWSALWFLNSTNVEKINLEYNEIKELPRRAFLDLPKLKWISFNYNDLETIHREVFTELPHLEYLGLKFNKLKVLNPRSFPYELDIKKLDLQANFFNFLPKKILINLQVKEISLFGNPWKCPCLTEIHQWLYDNNGIVKNSDSCSRNDMPVCAFPESYSQICRETIDEELTTSYLGKLKEMQAGDNETCINLD